MKGLSRALDTDRETMPILRFHLPFVDRIRMNSLLMVITSALLVVVPGCGDSDVDEQQPETTGRLDAQPAEISEELVSQIRAFCGDCHVMPDPASFPKYNWQEEVRRGFDFYVQSGRDDLTPPAVADVYQYFRRRLN